MATFNDATLGVATGQSTPDFGAQKKSQPFVNAIKFGSGYEQRVVFGINQNPKTWDLTWSAKSNSVSDAIENFFDARAGQESFDWTPLNDDTSYKWICRTWNRTHQYADINVVTATFEQVFEA